MLCVKHTVSGNGTVSTRRPLLQPWPCGNICGEGRTVQFPKNKLFYEAKMFPFYLSSSPAAMFSYTHCTSHVIYYRVPRESIWQPKKKKKNPYKICQKWKRTRAPYRVSMNGYATKLGTENTEIVESVQSLTKLNYIFKWSPPLHPKIESSMIYHGCHNSIWGQFLPLWPQDQNNFVLGTITVLKWQSCPQDPHHLLRWLLKHTAAFLTHFTHDQGPCKVKPQPHRERLAPHAHHIQFCFFLISCKDAFYLPFPTMRVFSYWEQKGG